MNEKPIVGITMGILGATGLRSPSRRWLMPIFMTVAVPLWSVTPK